MAILRRGTVKVPHKPAAYIVLTRFDGTPVKFFLRDLEAFEEYDVGQVLGKQVSIRHLSSFITVKESFDSINEEINGKAVTS